MSMKQTNPPCQIGGDLLFQHENTHMEHPNLSKISCWVPLLSCCCLGTFHLKGGSQHIWSKKWSYEVVSKVKEIILLLLNVPSYQSLIKKKTQHVLGSRFIGLDWWSLSGVLNNCPGSTSGEWVLMDLKNGGSDSSKWWPRAMKVRVVFCKNQK